MFSFGPPTIWSDDWGSLLLPSGVVIQVALPGKDTCSKANFDNICQEYPNCTSPGAGHQCPVCLCLRRVSQCSTSHRSSLRPYPVLNTYIYIILYNYIFVNIPKKHLTAEISLSLDISELPCFPCPFYFWTFSKQWATGPSTCDCETSTSKTWHCDPRLEKLWNNSLFCGLLFFPIFGLLMFTIYPFMWLSHCLFQMVFDYQYVAPHGSLEPILMWLGIS